MLKRHTLALLALLLGTSAGSASAHEVEPLPTDCQSGEEVPFLRYGAGTVHCAIDAATEVDRFEFVGDLGDVFRLVLVPDPSLDPLLVVRDPLGAVVGEGSCDGGAARGPSPSCALELDLDPLLLPQIDLYDVEVSDQGGDGTGAYQLQLELIPALQPSELIELSEPSFVDFAVLETATDVDQVAFDALALEQVRVDVEAFELDVDLDPRIEVFEPDGSLLESAACQGGSLPGTACSVTVSAVVPADGRYAFAISDEGHDDFGNQGGRYTYTFQRVPEPSRGTLACAALAAVALLARRRRP
jgi:hypothetical protein